MFGRRKSGYQSRSARSAPTWLVVGLGNPGPKYNNTPHNVGFSVIEQLSSQLRASGLQKFDGMYGVAKLPSGDDEIALLQPLTFMNLSGRSVKPALKSLGLQPEQLLVVHDEIDLEFGDIRSKSGGGLAGHNGLKSIAEMLGTRDFHRIRVGVGRPERGDNRPISAWILSSWQQDAAQVSQVVNEAVTAVMKMVDS